MTRAFCRIERSPEETNGSAGPRDPDDDRGGGAGSCRFRAGDQGVGQRRRADRTRSDEARERRVQEVSARELGVVVTCHGLRRVRPIAQPPDIAAPGAEPDVEPRDVRAEAAPSGREVVRIGQDFTLGAGDAAREVVVILGDASIAGRDSKKARLGTEILPSDPCRDRSRL